MSGNKKLQKLCAKEDKKVAEGKTGESMRFMGAHFAPAFCRLLLT